MKTIYCDGDDIIIMLSETDKFIRRRAQRTV